MEWEEKFRRLGVEEFGVEEVGCAMGALDCMLGSTAPHRGCGEAQPQLPRHLARKGFCIAPREDLLRLAQDSPWARRLGNRGRGADLEACLTLDTFALVPIYRADVDKIVPPSG